MRTDKSVRQDEFKTGAIGAASTVGSWLVATHTDIAALDQVGAVGGVVGITAAIGSAAHHWWYFSPHQKLVRSLGDQGWIDRSDLRTYAGASALYRQASYLRPDLPEREGKVRRRRQPATEYGFLLGLLVSGERLARGQSVYSPHGRSMLLVGPPGSGKSQWLTGPILDYPSAELVSSTKLELWETTHELREEVGPTWLWNPAGLGGVASDFGWDPVRGCQDQAIADRRAWALVRGAGGGDGIDRSDFWARKAQEIVRCYLMAAALQNMDMAAVHYWATNPDDRTPVGILEANPRFVPSAWLNTLKSSLADTPNTRTGYFATVVLCVGFMDNPAVMAACRPREADHFDVDAWLKAKGTLYLVGSDSDRRLAPLLTAFVEHVYDTTKTIAAMQKAGRLPLGALFALDEIANTTPVPLQHWAADSRGANITLIAVIQAEAQLRSTWGTDAASTIAQSLATKVYLGGISEEDDRRRAASLAGTRRVERISEGESVQRRHGSNQGWWDALWHNKWDGLTGSSSSSRNVSLVEEPVMHPDVLYGLPQGYAYIAGLGGRHAGVVRYEAGRDRVARELRAMEKRHAAAARREQTAEASEAVDDRDGVRA